MYISRVITCGLISLMCVSPGFTQEAEHDGIQKLGTIDIDTVETSPIVFDGTLYRFESVRPGYHGNDTGEAYFRFINTQTGQATPPFGQGHALGSAFVDEGKVYVFGVPGWGASSINVFVSEDMKTWEQHQALDLPGWELFNTSVCKAEGRYIMAFEVGGPAEVAGQRFTARFAQSIDLVRWELLPEPAVYTKEKYSACPTIRWHDGWFYMTYLNAIGGYRFETNIVRSRDLETWEPSPLNPLLTFDDRDKTIASDRLSVSQIAEVQEALNRNNSDFDFIEFEGNVVMYYSWGDQAGNEYLAKAYFKGSLDAFFTSYFPDQSE